MIIPDLKKTLEKNGVEKNDAVCVFSDITSFGIPRSMKEKVKAEGVDFLMESYIDTFKSLIGTGGMLVMPTFSYSACKGEVFSVEATGSTVGALTEYFRKKKGVCRSAHPIFSFCASGKGAEELLDITDFDCFGKDSVFGRLYDKHAKYVLFGVDMQHGASYVYYTEQKIGVYYRYFKYFPATVRYKSSEVKMNIRYFVRDLELSYTDYWHDLERKSIEAGVTRCLEFGGGRILTMKSQDIDALIREEVGKNKDYLIRR